MLKILHIIPSLSKGGAERLVITICNELQKRSGVDVRLVVLCNTNDYTQEMGTLSYDVIPAQFIPSFTKKSKRDMSQLQAYIEAYAPDVIHTHLWQSEIVCSQIDYSKALWVTHLHDNMPQLKRVRIPRTKLELTNAYERWIVTSAYKKRNAYFISISQDTNTFCKRNVPKKLRHSISMLHNAINTALFEHAKKTETYTTIKLVSVGSLVHKKNHAFLIPVVLHLISRGYTVQLDILGEGPLRKELEQEISKQNLTNTICLQGNVPVYEYYKQAQLYVHPATYEPFGLVLIEAMAAGLPLVCLDGKGNRDIIEQGKNGCMIFEQNPTLFAEKIIEICQDKEMYTSMSKYAVNFAKQYDIVPYVDRLLEIYTKSVTNA